ncbi:MAG TPA: hypothetical protein VGR67_10620 [Candidatus Polarisedimenticolia bacterium]|jgi:hypothetical protein|nr:hypothetical protein [Candidatus Polarisedimenticolia bacterium]
MRRAKVRGGTLLGLGGGVILILALGIAAVGVPSGGALAQNGVPRTVGDPQITGSKGDNVDSVVVPQPEALCAALTGTCLNGCVEIGGVGYCRDFTGEICRSGSKTVSGRVYCVMKGNLGKDAANGDRPFALEIDDTDGNPPNGTEAGVADANLSKGDTNNDPDLPALSGPATYEDWANLAISTLPSPGSFPIGSVEDHRILDWTASADETTVPGSCLERGNAGGKDDFTQTYIANNDEFLYFAQERRTNNGNARVVWILSHLPPIAVATGSCAIDPVDPATGIPNHKGELQFKLSDGDVRLEVTFPSGSSVGIATGDYSVKRYNGNSASYVAAAAAVFDPNWATATFSIQNISVNADSGSGIATVADDSFGPWGGITAQGKQILTGTFSKAQLLEWAVPITGPNSIFGDTGLCGQELYFTGVTYASSGGGASLKDEIGPKLYSFGGVTATVHLDTDSIDCGDAFHYQVEVRGINGELITPDSVTWSCSATVPGEDPPTTHFVELSDGVHMPGTICTADAPATLTGLGTGCVDRNDDGTPHEVKCTATVSAQGCDDVLADATITVDGSLSAIDVALASQTQSCCAPLFNLGLANGSILPDGFTFNPVITGGTGEYDLTWFIKPSTLGIGCPDEKICSADEPNCHASVTPCTVKIPDDVYCATALVHILVNDHNKRSCLSFSRDFGFIKKATIFQFTTTPPDRPENNQVSCSANVVPPSPACPTFP